MITIWKFPLKIRGSQTIEFPEFHTVLHVAMQRTEICVWAQVDDKSPKIQKTFQIRGTGQIIDIRCRNHIGTVDAKASDEILHVYETDWINYPRRRS